MESRKRIIRRLIMEWHPDKHKSTGDDSMAAYVFRYVRKCQDWFYSDAETKGPKPNDPH